MRITNGDQTDESEWCCSLCLTHVSFSIGLVRPRDAIHLCVMARRWLLDINPVRPHLAPIFGELSTLRVFSCGLTLNRVRQISSGRDSLRDPPVRCQEPSAIPFGR